MKGASDPIQGSDNMLKRLNKFIIAKIWSIRLRPAGAAFLGACAGLSLTSTILPEVIAAVGVSDSFSVRVDLAGFAVYSVMLWAVGGWAARKTASALRGAVVLGLAGSASAALFVGMAYPGVPVLLLLGAAAGLVYGAFGGMLIAAALGDPAPASN